MAGALDEILFPYSRTFRLAKIQRVAPTMTTSTIAFRSLIQLAAIYQITRRLGYSSREGPLSMSQMYSPSRLMISRISGVIPSYCQGL